MKKIMLFLFFLVCGYQAHAANCLIPTGASNATIQAAINAAATNSCTGTTASNLAQLSAGTYTISSSLGFPCPTSAGMVFQGPVVPLAKYTAGDGYVRLGYTPTALLVPSGLVGLPNNFSTQTMIMSGACANTTTIQYIETDGQHRNPDGGGAVYIPNNGSNIVITRNYFHGNWADASGGNFIDSLILLDGGQGEGGPTKSNITVSWNRLGNTGDCQNIMSGENYDGNSEESGGLCNAIGYLGNSNSFHILNNFIYYQEQGMKFYEGGCTPDSDPHCAFTTANLFVLNDRQIKFNDISNIHRIPLESQNTPLTSDISYNTWHDAYLAGLGGTNGSWMISVPEGPSWGCGVSNCNQPGNQITNNMMIYNVAAGGTQFSPGNPVNGSGPTIEFWGQAPFANNFVQGYAGCGMQFGFWLQTPSPGLVIESNIMRMYNVNTYGFTCSEEPVSIYPPGSTQFGNFNALNFGLNSGGGSTWVGTLNSQLPTINPSGGSFSGSQTVTLTDPGYTGSTGPSGYSNGYGPQGNTGVWYTTDGSTPVPGQGTANRLDSGGTFTIASPGTTTVKAVGMWGAANQQASYQSGFGFVPSAVVTAVFNGSGGTPTAQAPTFNPPAPQTFGVATPITIATTTTGATIYYTTDGTTPTTSSPVYTGPVNLTATTTLQAFATAPGFLPSSITTGQYTYSLFLGNPNSDTGGGTYQNVFNWVYAVTSTASGGYTVQSCSMNITAGAIVTGSASTDCVVALAPTSTTIASTPICHGTYSNGGNTSGPGVVTVPMTGCGTLTPSTAYWIGVITNDPLGPSPYAFWDCGGGCHPTPVPTVNNGTYNGFFGGGTYGNYSNLNASAFQTSGTQLQPTASLNLTQTTSPQVATPVISPGSETFSGSITVSISDSTPGTVIHYTTDGTTPTSGSPVYAAPFPITSTTMVNAIGIATGFTNSALASSTYTLTGATVLSSYLSTTTNLNWVVPGQTAQFSAVINYSDGVQTSLQCTGPSCADTRGTYISSWLSQFTGVGTMSSLGVFTPVSVTAVGANGQEGLTIIQALLTEAGGGTTASSFWYETIARSANSIIQGGTLNGVTVF